MLRDTEHFYWKLSEFQEPLLEWLRTREGWRPHVVNFAIGMVDDGLHDRAFTRDLEAVVGPDRVRYRASVGG